MTNHKCCKFLRHLKKNSEYCAINQSINESKDSFFSNTQFSQRNDTVIKQCTLFHMNICFKHWQKPCALCVP